MKIMASRPVTALLLLCAASLQAQQLPNLTNQNPSARFTLTDRVWSTNAGDASVCLWADDKLATISVSVDDNSADNISWWLTQSAAYGFKMTWFVITENVGNGKANDGTWAIYNSVQALGHEVQSHSMNHLNTNSPSWVDIDTEYWGSQLAIETNMPGHKCDFLAYPGGANQYLNNRTNAAKYYAAARGGGGGAITAANKIDYFATGTMSSYNLSTPNSFSYLPNLLTNTYASCYRGLACQLWHWISPTNYVSVQPFLDFIDTNRADLWVGRFGDIMKYGEERDTATLTTNENSSARIALMLTDQMLDSRFNQPLTIKVRLPAAWSNVQAAQNGQAIASRVVTYNGGNYALVQAVPDQGEIALTTSAADFTAAPASGWAPLPVTFTDTSSGVITSRFWDFGDGTTTNTTAASVTHSYTTGGVYTVQLVASGPGGASTNTQVNCISVTTPVAPLANFIASPTNGLAPLPVFFTETSTGSITNRFWDFGDGTTTNTTATSVTHTYTSAGTNTVKLIVNGPAGSSTNTQTNCVRTAGIVALSARFAALPTNGAAPLAVSFSDTSTGSITNRFWDFGDGATSNTTATSITHTYTTAGTNTVQLIVSGPDGASTNTQIAAVTVTVPAPPSASFTAAPTSGTAPLAVTFTDTSTGSITNRFWNFGDGATTNTTSASVAHTYAITGTNTVQLIVSGIAGASTNTQPNLISVTPAVSASVLTAYSQAPDQSLYGIASNALPWINSTTIRVGYEIDSKGGIAYVMVFRLPTLAAGETISSASLSMYETASVGNNKRSFNLDVYGVRAANSTTVKTNQFDSDFYEGPSDPLSTKLVDNFFSVITTNPTPAGVYSNAPAAAFGSWLASFYNGATPLYSNVFIRINADIAFNNYTNSSQGASTFATFASGDYTNAVQRPTLIMYTTVPPPPVSAPVITGALLATGTVGQAFSYQIAADNSPTGFNATGLPSGLSVNTNSGAITGTPTGAGSNHATISASNAGGTDSKTLAVVISPVPVDGNGNGIPDAWESQYGIINANPNALSANGINTILEAYIAGLDPTNSAARLGLSVQQAAGQRLLQWSAVSGRVYSVYWTTNLFNSFQPLETNIVWPQSSWTDSVHGAQGGSFYRIKVQLGQ